MKIADEKYQLYNDEIMERFLHPKNMGSAQDENAVGEVGSSNCGDIIRLSLHIDKDKRIQEAKVKVFGCGAALSAADTLCDLIHGKTIEEAYQVNNMDVMNELGGADEWNSCFPVKIHCSLLSAEAISAALDDYISRHKVT